MNAVMTEKPNTTRIEMRRRTSDDDLRYKAEVQIRRNKMVDAVK